jgi:hypothetical protein
MSALGPDLIEGTFILDTFGSGSIRSEVNITHMALRIIWMPFDVVVWTLCGSTGTFLCKFFVVCAMVSSAVETMMNWFSKFWAFSA